MDQKDRQQLVREFLDVNKSKAHLMHKQLHQILKHENINNELSHEALHVLHLIEVHEGISIKKLCEVNSKSRMLNWKLVKTLEESKLVEKRPNPKDKRQPLHFLTKQGLNLVQEKNKIIYDSVAYFLSEFSDEEIVKYNELTKKICEKICNKDKI